MFKFLNVVRLFPFCYGCYGCGFTSSHFGQKLALGDLKNLATVPLEITLDM